MSGTKAMARVVAALLVFGSIGLGACGDSGGDIDLTAVASIAFNPPMPENTYTFSLAEVAPGEETSYTFLVINTGDGPLEIRELNWTYNAADPAAEATKPAFSCTFGDDEQPCAGAAGLPLFVAPQNDPDSEYPDALVVTIRFYRYEDDEARQGSLSIRHNDTLKDPSALVFGTSDALPRLVASPDRVEFTDVEKGDTDTLFVTLLNTGSSDLVIDRFTYDADPPFSITMNYPAPTAQDPAAVNPVEYVTNEETRTGVTVDPPVTLAPNKSMSVEVSYTAESIDSATGQLRLHSNDPRTEWTPVLIEANMTGPILIPNPEQVEFGGKFVGRMAPAQLQLFSRGTEAVTITDMHFAQDSSPDFSIDTTELTADGQPISADNPLVIQVNDVKVVNVYYTPDVENDIDEQTGEPVYDLGTLVIENNSFEPTLEIPTSGYGILQECPVPVIIVEEGDEVIPQTTLHLKGDQSYAMAGDIRKWEWRVEQPVGSQSVFIPSATFPTPTFEANVAGTYTFYLDVWDENNVKSCEPAQFDVLVIPDEAIHIELLWNTPGDEDETDTGPFAGSDVDLHFLHPRAYNDPSQDDIDGDGSPDPYFHEAFDCYWFNPHPDWGSTGQGIDDDPGLDRDDVDGAGPENINLNIPEHDMEYEVAIHYWNDHGYGASFVTVRVYIYENLVFEIPNVRLTDLDMWCTAFVHWPSGQVRACTATGGGYRITPNYETDDFIP